MANPPAGGLTGAVPVGGVSAMAVCAHAHSAHPSAIGTKGMTQRRRKSELAFTKDTFVEILIEFMIVDFWLITGSELLTGHLA